MNDQTWKELEAQFEAREEREKQEDYKRNEE
jgi:hypothetical protein